MTDVREDKDDNKPKENIFRIMDGIITQLNRTKKMFIIMILTIMIIPPIAFALSFALLGPPFPLYGGAASRQIWDRLQSCFWHRTHCSISNLHHLARNWNMAVVCALKMDQKIRTLQRFTEKCR